MHVTPVHVGTLLLAAACGGQAARATRRQLREGELRHEGSGFEASGDLTEVEVFCSTTEGVEVGT